jgi:hypothetical protein
MLFKAQWIPDDTDISSTLILCNSTRGVGEHNVRLNNRALGETAEPYQSDWVENLNRYNERNTFSFECWRDANLDDTPFADEYAAFYFAALHCGGQVKTYAVRGTGQIILTMAGSAGSYTLTFANALKQSIDVAEWDGIVIKLHYAFTTGPISG